MNNIKKSVEYQVFIKNRSSSRPQHLSFNDRWYRLLWFACPAAAVSMFASSLYHGGDILMFWELFFVPPLFRLHEIFATPDNDEAYKVHGFRGFYWTIYSRWFKHRSVWSHTIALGTPLRFCIAYWFPILVFVVVWNYEVVWAVSQGAIALSTGLQMLTFPDFATRFIGFWYAACLLSDIAHLILDKYNPIEWLIGKR